MGLFSRKDSAPSRKPIGKPRPSVTSEAQAADLRIKARRRLAGAVALILAAVVVLPMLLDSEPAPVASNIPIRIPDRQSPFQPNLSEPSTSAAPTATASTSGQVTASSEATPASANTTPQTKPDAASKPALTPSQDSSRPATTSPPAAPSAQQRRDDAARALALLEGRSPVASAPSANPPVRGNFVVQAMSLDSSAEAQKQRNVLISAGLNNAFVDGPVDVNGRPKYRVRVGPFQSREAAQAAQTRLRTQGYGGAFIATQ
ncbi:Sporulation-like domain containing protein [Burkholderiaceae bacterium]